jgi:hypothetical protein
MSFQMAKLRRMAVYRDKSETTGLVMSALCVAQSQFLPIERETEADWGMFASLNSMIRATKKALTDNGLAIHNEYQSVDGQLYLITVLTHGESDEWVSSMLPIKMVEDTQDTVAYMTTMRRVNYAAVLCLAPEDEKKAEQKIAGADAQAAAKAWVEQKALASNAIAAAATAARLDQIVATVKDKIAKHEMDPHDLAAIEESANRRRADLQKAASAAPQVASVKRATTKGVPA